MRALNESGLTSFSPQIVAASMGAWFLSSTFLGHQEPIFAAVLPLVSLELCERREALPPHP